MVETYFDKKLAEEYNDGYNKGINQGINEKAVKTAINMISKGKLSLEDIAEYSELPLDKVKELAASLSA